jgi:hypothetical protein
LQWFPNLLRSTAFQPVVLSSAGTGRRVFAGSETVTHVALRPGWRGSHSGAASAWLCQIRRLRPFVTLLERLPSSVSAQFGASAGCSGPKAMSTEPSALIAELV